jgi:hypothetical protein
MLPQAHARGCTRAGALFRVAVLRATRRIEAAQALVEGGGPGAPPMTPRSPAGSSASASG